MVCAKLYSSSRFLNVDVETLPQYFNIEPRRIMKVFWLILVSPLFNK
jgi:hypothetical protein